MRTLLLAATLLPMIACADAQPQDEAVGTDIAMTEWSVPWAASRPRDPIVDAAGTVWFVGQVSHYIGRLDPATGEFGRFELPAGAGPHNVIVGPDGSLWYAGNTAAHIGRMDPATGQITRFDMPAGARDPHTLIFAPTGHLWFTVQGDNQVGRLDPATGDVDLITPAGRSRPYGIIIAPDGTPWIAAFGTNKLLSIDPETLALTEHAIPRGDARPRRLVATSDGAIWYVDYAGGRLGRLDPASRQFREWDAPGGTGSRPYAMALDDSERIWFFETGSSPNRLVGFDPESGAFIAGGAPESGGGTVRHMVYDEASGALWFGTDTNTIGRAVVR